MVAVAAGSLHSEGGGVRQRRRHRFLPDLGVGALMSRLHLSVDSNIRRDSEAMVVPFCGSRRRLTTAAAILVLISGPSTRGGVIAQDFPSSPRNVRVYAGAATVPLATLRIAPSTTVVLPGEVVQFVATVTGTSNTTVVWS